VVDALNHIHGHEHEYLDIVKALDALPYIAAYEILDPLGNGGLVYPDWK
jgi:hypothetical protein